MDVMFSFILVKVFAGAVITAAFAFIAFREANAFLFRWTIGWLFFFLWGAFDLVLVYVSHPAMIITGRLFLLAGSLFLLQGTLLFLDTRIKKFWLFAGIVLAGFILFSAACKFDYALLTVPVLIFAGCVFLVMGAVFLKTRILRGVSSYIAGAAMALWGLQVLAAAVFIALTGGANWIYSTTGFYSIIVALFLVISYFDRVRALHKESDARYRSLFHENHAPMLIIDPENSKILAMNQASLDFYGYTKKDLPDLTVYDIAGHDRVDVDWGVSDVLKSGARRFETVNRTAGGEEREVEVFNGTLRLDGKTVLTSVVFDITERKKAEREVELARDELEKANAVKQEFMANMSHELRTPLNGILGMASLLKETGLNEEQLNYLEMINVSGENLYRVINDILNFSDIVSKDFEIEMSDFNLRDLMEWILKRFRAEAEAKELDVRFFFDPAVPRKINSDKLRLSQICINLISNAIKFTEAGGIELSVRFNDPNIIITVSDSGVGIDKQSLDAIFGMFTLGVSTYTKRYAGAGVGLAVVKELVDKLGGTISVDSAPGEGSVFTVRLPAAMAEEQSDEAFRAVDQGDEGFEAKGLRVLVAEDEVINRMYLEEFLRLRGAEVVSVRTGEDACARALAEGFDIILMDISMPKMNGLEAAENIRSLEKTSRTPIIALTAYTYQEDIDRCMDAGMDDFLSKPVDENRLIELIRTFTAKPPV